MKTEKKEVKRIAFVPVIKIAALFGVVFGILALLYLFLLRSFPAVAVQMGIDTSAVSGASLVMAPLTIILYYVLIGIIVVALYNWFAKLVGGIKVDLK